MPLLLTSAAEADYSQDDTAGDQRRKRVARPSQEAFAETYTAALRTAPQRWDGAFACCLSLLGESLAANA